MGEWYEDASFWSDTAPYMFGARRLEQAVEEADRIVALLGLEPPPAEAFESAELSPAMRGFYSACRRVKNARIKAELGVVLRHPDYRAGLRALLE